MKYLMNHVLLLLLPLSMPALGLGDLFFTVQQRIALDVAREQGVTKIDKTGQAQNLLKVNGFYFNNIDKRNKATVWVNGALTNDKNTLNGAQLNSINERDKTVSVVLDKTRSSIALKAGQALHLGTGELRDSFEELGAKPHER